MSLLMLAVGAMLAQQAGNTLAAIQQQPEWANPTPQQQQALAHLKMLLDLGESIQKRAQVIHDQAQLAPALGKVTPC